MSSSFDQATYQVRFDWGRAGLKRLASAEVVIIVDVLLFSTSVTGALAAGRGSVSPEEAKGDTGVPLGMDGDAIAGAAGADDSAVFAGCLRNASAVAEAVLAEQRRRGERTSIAVIAAGDEREGSGVRFGVEDQFGAGAVIAALGDLGIDHTSPEAAAAAETFRALRPALKHLLTASGSGRELVGAGRKAEVVAAAALDADEVAPVLREGGFVRAGE